MRAQHPPMYTCSPPITSVSSCTSSIVGHGSAICARGIFSQDSHFPPQIFLGRLGCRVGAAAAAAPVKRRKKSSFARVRSPGRFSFLRSALLRSEEKTRSHGGEEEDRGRCKSFTNNCNPLIRLRRRSVTLFARLFEVIVPAGDAKTRTSSVLLPGVYARRNTRDSALTRERCPPKKSSAIL